MTLDLVLLAVAIAVNPLPMTAFILVMTAPHGAIARGVAWCAAWVTSLVGITVITLAFTGGRPPRPHTAPSTIGLVVRIVVGVGLLWFAWTRQRARGKPRPAPKWMARLDRASPLTAAAISFLLQPWGMIIAAAATISRANLDNAASFVAVGVFCLVASLSYLIMVACVALRPDGTRARLANLRSWIDAHMDAVVITLSVVVGLWLVGNSAYLLAA